MYFPQSNFKLFREHTCLVGPSLHVCSMSSSTISFHNRISRPTLRCFPGSQGATLFQGRVARRTRLPPLSVQGCPHLPRVFKTSSPPPSLTTSVCSEHVAAIYVSRPCPAIATVVGRIAHAMGHKPLPPFDEIRECVSAFVAKYGTQRLRGKGGL